jgi:hypothetical protein
MPKQPEGGVSDGQNGAESGAAEERNDKAAPEVQVGA